MTFDELLALERKIWGEQKQTPEHIAVCIGKVYGDICKQVRLKIETGEYDETELKKEMGNLISSLTRWCDDLGFDVNECIGLALKAQEKYSKN